MSKEVVYVKQKKDCLTWVIAIFIIMALSFYLIAFCLGILSVCHKPNNKPSKQVSQNKVVFKLQSMEEIPEGFFISGGIRNYTKKPIKANVKYRIFENDVLVKEGDIANFLYENLEPDKGTTFGDVIEYQRNADAIYTYQLEVKQHEN